MSECLELEHVMVLSLAGSKKLYSGIFCGLLYIS